MSPLPAAAVEDICGASLLALTGMPFRFYDVITLASGHREASENRYLLRPDQAARAQGAICSLGQDGLSMAIALRGHYVFRRTLRRSKRQ
jgi:hypothetical protein